MLTLRMSVKTHKAITTQDNNVSQSCSTETESLFRLGNSTSTFDPACFVFDILGVTLTFADPFITGNLVGPTFSNCLGKNAITSVTLVLAA